MVPLGIAGFRSRRWWKREDRWASKAKDRERQKEEERLSEQLIKIFGDVVALGIEFV